HNSVDQVAAEGQVEALVAHYVLELLADADHLLLPLHRQHHGEARVEENPLHNDVVTHKVVDKLPNAILPGGGETRVQDALGKVDDEFVLLADRGNRVVHAVNLLGVQTQG